jgi:hypothetical protein
MRLRLSQMELALTWTTSLFGPLPEGLLGPEQRKHTRTLYTTHGTPLITAEGPQQLLTGILHGMLGCVIVLILIFLSFTTPFQGHWNLFKAGRLHRDVNEGNVMLTNPEERDPVLGCVQQC